MKFRHLIEYNQEIFLLKDNAQNEAARLVPDLFFFFFLNFILGESKWFST